MKNWSFIWLRVCLFWLNNYGIKKIMNKFMNSPCSTLPRLFITRSHVYHAALLSDEPQCTILILQHIVSLFTQNIHRSGSLMVALIEILREGGGRRSKPGIDITGRKPACRSIYLRRGCLRCRYHLSHELMDCKELLCEQHLIKSTIVCKAMKS